MTPDSRVAWALARLRDEGFTPSGILDIGAHDGDFARGARRVFPSAYVLMIDALAEKDAVLRDVAREIGNASHVVALLGEREIEAAPFFVVDTVARPDLVRTGSSKFRENTPFPMEETRVPQTTLGTIVADSPISYELIKLDVQGAELEVLRGFGAGLSVVEAILIEMSLVEYNAGAPLIATVMAGLAALGFVLFDLVEEHRYRDGALLQVDGLFLRPGSRFRPQPPFWGG